MQEGIALCSWKGNWLPLEYLLLFHFTFHIHSTFTFEPPFLCYPFLTLLAMKIQSVSERVGATYFWLLSPLLKMFYAPPNLSETISRPTHSRSDIKGRCADVWRDLKRNRTAHGGLYWMGPYPKMSFSWTLFQSYICPGARLKGWKVIQGSFSNSPSINKFTLHLTNRK